MRRLLVVVGVLILLAGIATAYYAPKHRFGGSIKGASTPAVDRLGRGSVYETFLNRHPCGRDAATRGDGELLVVAAGPSHRLRWKKHLGASETSPLIVGNRIYVGDAEGNVYCLRTV